MEWMGGCDAGGVGGRAGGVNEVSGSANGDVPELGVPELGVEFGVVTGAVVESGVNVPVD
jgi:hypothetical protein